VAGFRGFCLVAFWSVSARQLLPAEGGHADEASVLQGNRPADACSARRGRPIHRRRRRTDQRSSRRIRRVVDDEQARRFVSVVSSTVGAAGREREGIAHADHQWRAAVLKLVFDGAANHEPSVAVQAPLVALCPRGVFNNCPAMAFDVSLAGTYSGNVLPPVNPRELDRDVFDRKSQTGSILWHDPNLTAVKPAVGPSRRGSVVRSAQQLLLTRSCQSARCRRRSHRRRPPHTRRALSSSSATPFRWRFVGECLVSSNVDCDEPEADRRHIVPHHEPASTPAR
jgi:hypothetical protein